MKEFIVSQKECCFESIDKTLYQKSHSKREPHTYCDFVDGEFANIKVVSVLNDGGGNVLCRCNVCGNTFMTSKRALKKVAELVTGGAKRRRVTCKGLLQEYGFVINSPDSYIGKNFGKLTIIGFDDKDIKYHGCDDGTNNLPYITSSATALCKCDCGNEDVRCKIGNIVAKSTQSCGCLIGETQQAAAEKRKTHGKIVHTQERLYWVWQSMIQRCHCETNKNYHYYGGRGITVCDTWKHSYLAFRRWALANGYDPLAPKGECTIDRIDNNRGYKPSNCRWVSAKEQNVNKVDAILYTYYGRTMNARQWSKYFGIEYSEMLCMLHQGLSIGRICRQIKNTTKDFQKEIKDNDSNYQRRSYGS